MQNGKFRAILRAKVDGAEFPIYLEKEDEAEEVADFLKASVVSVSPATPAQYAVDLITALARGTNVTNE